MKKIYLAAFLTLIGMSGWLRALTVEVDKYDAYSAIPSTANVLYVEKCSKSKLAPYEWGKWEGYYHIRSYVQPVATIIVKRGPTDLFDFDTPFLEKALQESMKVGGNILCYVELKRSTKALGIESIAYRAYRQMFQAGSKTIIDFYNDISVKSLPLTLKDVQP